MARQETSQIEVMMQMFLKMKEDDHKRDMERTEEDRLREERREEKERAREQRREDEQRIREDNDSNNCCCN